MSGMFQSRSVEHSAGNTFSYLVSPLATTSLVMRQILFIVGLISVAVRSGSVIPPPWAASLDLNPCSAVSWQQVMWPEDGQCYPIYRQGPCAETQELVWHTGRRRPICVCPRDHLLHSASGRCHRRNSRGPCPPRHYFSEALSRDLDNARSSDVKVADSACHEYKTCAAGEIFWPPSGKCFAVLTRGPCDFGQLLFVNGSSGEPQCGCHRRLMVASYWPHTDSCHEHYTRGPCPIGLVFVYSPSRGHTQCTCEESMRRHFHTVSGQCYQLGTRGPCPLGAIFTYNATSGSSGCECQENEVRWASNGQCYHAYTRGPCSSGEWLAPLSTHPQLGVCENNQCKRGELYFPEHKECHRIGERGKCPLGQLVMYEPFGGVSQRGWCGCSRHFTRNFWPADNRCYQLHTAGPCPPMFTFVFNSTAHQPQCVCDERRGRAVYPVSGSCHQLQRQGPCPPTQMLIRNRRGEVNCGCRLGRSLDTRINRCISAKRSTESIKSLRSAVRVLR